MQVAIIIVTYNSLQWIERCLKSCQDFHVIVVDNASTDGTVSFIHNHFKQVQVLAQSVNHGFGQGNNLGICKALTLGYDAVFLLNQDAYLEEDSLRHLIAMSQTHPDYGILSPVHTNGLGNDYDLQFYKYATVEADYLPRNFDAIGGAPSLFDVYYVNAAGWLVTKSCLEIVGGFDPLFFHYGEDNNYCQRARFFNFRIGICTNAFIRHDRESRPKVSFKPGSALYFSRLERKLKSRYGDITKANLTDLKRLQYKRFKECLKALAQFRFTEARSKLKEVWLINRLYPLIKVSRDTNSISKFKRYL